MYILIYFTKQVFLMVHDDIFRLFSFRKSKTNLCNRWPLLQKLTIGTTVRWNYWRTFCHCLLKSINNACFVTIFHFGRYTKMNRHFKIELTLFQICFWDRIRPSGWIHQSQSSSPGAGNRSGHRQWWGETSFYLIKLRIRKIFNI